MEPLNENTRWFLDHIIEAFVGLVALMGTLLTYVWNQTNTAHESALEDHKIASEKALTEHKEMNAKMHEDTRDELTLHRQYFSKIFDKLDENSKELNASITQIGRDSERRHERLLERLDGKADKK